MTQSSPDGLLKRAFESLREIPPPEARRSAAKRSAFLAQARGYRGFVAPANQGVLRTLGLQPLRTIFTRRPSMLNILAALAIVVAVLSGTGGVAYAADGAGPGDPLYGIDRSMESIRLSLARGPQATIGLLLAHAEERLLEAEELPEKGSEKKLQLALSLYWDTIAALAENVSTVEEADEPALTTLLDEALSAHEDKLSGILGSDDHGRSESCTDRETHPVAERLAERLAEISDRPQAEAYDRVMDWFCSGYGYGEIMHALVAADQDPAADPAVLLALKTELGGWGEVWQEMGLIGPPDDRPVGPPEDKDKGQPDDRPVGPPEDNRPVGPPEDKDKGQPDDRPVGPPEDKDKGQPDDRPVGPPEDKDKGQPDDRPVGPPKDKPEKPEKR
jgi:hypothetical protein